MSLLRTIENAQEFATLPTVAAKILSLLEQDTIDLREVTRLIETDPSLTMKMLQMANSPLFAVRGNVSSVNQAVLTLGMNRVANIVLSVSIFSKFILILRRKSAEFLERFWLHSASTAIVAKTFASKVNRKFKEQEFIGGLLHDIGKTAMLQFEPEKFEQTLDMIRDRGITDIQAEQEVFGVDHCAVGAVVARLWRLPAQISEVVACHHDVSTSANYRELVSLVRVSDMLCEIWGAGVEEGIVELELSEHEAWKELCAIDQVYRDLDVEYFTFELEKEFREASSFLNLVASESA